ncbi:MAG: CHASE2 domain-containing protein [Gammaproteobacteria bacterium]|nr:CHASE2 domain-containing protein [Gammaproteobacteria bacterium]MBQ0775534.1 CHASE2 domain-containing protein [Gammaproteobacteria bacterium]
MSLRTRHQRRFYLEHLLVTLVIAVFAMVLVLMQAPTFLDRYIYDSMMQRQPVERETELVIVGIDEFSLRELGRWPWDRARLAELIDRLHEYGSGPVLLDLLLTEPDLSRPASDVLLGEALERHGQVYLPVHIEQQTAGGQLVELLPHRRFASRARAMGHVDLEMDSDGVVRSVFLRSGIGQPWWPHITLAMLNDVAPDAAPNKGKRIAEKYPAQPSSHRGTLANVRQYQRFIPFGGDAGSYPQVSAVDVIKGRVLPQLLAGRTIMIGATAAGLGDLLVTPLTVSGQLMPGVEVNANIYDALLSGQFIERMGDTAIVVTTLVIALLAPLLLPIIPPRWGMPMVAGVMALTLALVFILLRQFHLWMPPGAPLLVTVVAYPLWTWRRLEYTLDYLRAALSRLSRYTDLNRRLSETVSMAPLIRMLERVLPVDAWRLEQRGGAVQTGGIKVPERSWQSSRAGHFCFLRGHQHYELSVLWRDTQASQALQGWMVAMINRVNSAAPAGGAAYEIVEHYIERAADEEMRQQALTHFFNASLDQLREGVLMCDACGSLLYANSRALAWLDITTEQVDGLHLLDLAHGLTWLGEQLDWPTLIGAAMADGHVEQECRRHDGAELMLELASVDAGVRPGRVLIVTLKDVTVIKSALRTRTELLDYLSHDLRSPMISVMALAEKMRHTEQGKNITAFLDSIDLHARKNLNISEQFLQLARVEALEQVELAQLDMLPVVESALEQVQPQAAERDITIRFHYDPRDDVWVRGNHELLERLMLNLLTNAVKYSHPGNSVDVTLSVTKASAEVPARVEVAVRDRGVGIAPEFVEQVFDRYSRAPSETAAKIRGAGLGLRFVKVVSERHGGDISVTSQPGEGSRFLLSLPHFDVGDLADA